MRIKPSYKKNIIILLIWVLIFASTPLYMLYEEFIIDSEVDWQELTHIWSYEAGFLVIFLIWHVFYLRIFTKAINGTPISYELLQTLFTSSPITTLLYTIGMFAAIFHFCNGITTFCMTWGIAKGPRIQNVINVLSMCLCAFLCLVTIAFMASYFVM